MNAERRSLLPPFIRKPHFVFWTLILPQLVLLVLNLRSWGLVRTEMSDAQRHTALQLLGAEIGLLVLGALVLATLAVLRRRMGWPVCLPVMAVHVAYLWFVTTSMEGLIPTSVSLWILPPMEFLYYQYAFIMPAIFYSLLLVAAFDTRLPLTADAGISVATLVGVPVMAFLLLQAGDALFRSSRFREVEIVVLCLFVIACTALTFMAFLRLLVYIHGAVSKQKAGRIILCAAAGIVAPLGGLLLNIGIPFPFDFQAPSVYVLTVLNGIILLLPRPAEERPGTWLWLGRCIMYPFTLYFFLVFLPYLPLSLLAMLAAGAGFLILAPTLLFIVHTRRLFEEGRQLAARIGVLPAVLLFVACQAVLPLLYTGRAMIDRRALMRAVDFVYSPDYTESMEPAFNRSSARRALRRLNKRKNGIYVPFLSEYYSRIVFGGMVLPDHKMKTIYTTLFGEELKIDRGGLGFDGFFGMRPSRMGARAGNVRPPSRNVKLQEIDTSLSVTNGIVHASIALTMQNDKSANAEFITRIHVPDGVLVSGYWLDVEGTNVPGRVFEKKTAMWVYHMIRDVVNRDPGLVVFESDNTVKLNVFPFASKQERTTGIRFLYPEGLAPTIRVGDRDVAISADAGDSPPGSPVRVPLAASGQAYVFPARVLDEMPTIVRPRHLHVLIDAANGAADDFDGYAGRIAAVAEKFPDVIHCRLSLVNYAVKPLAGGGMIPLTEVDRVLDKAGLTPDDCTGGFCPDRAIRSLLLSYEKAGIAEALQVPVFVALQATDTKRVTTGNLSAFERLVPEEPAYYLSLPGAGLQRVGFDGTEHGKVTETPSPRPVVCLAGEGGVAAAPAGNGSATLVLPASAGEVKVLKTASLEGAVPLENVAAVSENSLYAQGLQLWEAYRHTQSHPATITERLPNIVTASRETGVLVPLTSYIVVENQAQWEMLKRKEKQKLKADHALDFDEHQESPAPPALWLVPVVLVLLWRSRRKASCTAR